ncbi:MAG: hypothetical protein AB1640_15085 [bacterium]
MEHSTTRVSRHTPTPINERIRSEIERNISCYAAGGPEAIDKRLRELDREWDIERVLEANAATLALLGLALGRFLNRRFYAFPAVVATFLLQHAIQGWCPPVPLFRRMGVRTRTEIDYERYALKALRGDFKEVSGNGGEYSDYGRLVHIVQS